MRPVFADTSFFVSFLSTKEPRHARAMEIMGTYAGRVITSTWILVELGNAMLHPRTRPLIAKLVHELRVDARFHVLEASAGSFAAGLALYDSRHDKSWSLIDCISFSIMHDRGLRAAITLDHHFKQAGFETIF